ncbi:hypothetical protein [Mesoterricola silvestris]|uniref:Uncharacterized protein n=1 Tax=Mesoterricola silvestris TaxID=2927979 RepID=A0AA48K829_9BACT|nr:hypothetical protein [Mesoterricola silvestris]BDU71796.1 hypothetical protein METEAL_09700 [Mesoterricola silvestris]
MNVVCQPHFVREALSQAGPVREGLSKLIRIAGELSFSQLLNHQGLHLEKLQGKLDPDSKKPLYSLRATRAARVIATVDGDFLMLLAIVPDHDKAY